MKAEFKKRLVAYLLDLLIVGLLLGLIISVKEKDQKVMQLRSDLNIVNEVYASREMKFTEYFDRYTTINQQIDQECIIYMIFNMLFILSYFVILPYFWNGQTLGKRLMKIKVTSSVEEKVSIVSYLIRNSIINGLGYMFLMLLVLYLLPNKMYFIFSSILSFIQLILVITSVSMILYRKDKRGLHDILSTTKVVLVS